MTEPRDKIGGDGPPVEFHIPVDDVDVIRLEYRGQWYEVVKTDDGLKLRSVQRGQQ